jgi:hypothetical protein
VRTGVGGASRRAGSLLPSLVRFCERAASRLAAILWTKDFRSHSSLDSRDVVQDALWPQLQKGGGAAWAVVAAEIGRVRRPAGQPPRARDLRCDWSYRGHF